MAITSSFLNEFLIIIILLLLQITTLYFVWRIGKLLRMAKFWTLIILALAILVVRRITSFLILFGVFPPSQVINSIDNIYIPLIFWIFMSLGMFELYQKIKSQNITNYKRPKKRK